jgi:hypothetical protein
MKNFLLGVFFLFVVGLSAASSQTQEDFGFVFKPFSVGSGMEINQNARHIMVPEIVLSLDYEITPIVTIGLKVGMTEWADTEEHETISVMEGVFIGRYYLYPFLFGAGKKKPIPIQIRPYIQTGLGMSYSREIDYTVLDYLGEAAIGGRFHFSGWFADLGVRYGYPFHYGVNLILGHSFLP